MLRQLTNDELHTVHDRLIQVMAAIIHLNQRDRGRPTDVKLAFLQQHHPEDAQLAMFLVDGNFKAFYDALCEDACKDRAPVRSYTSAAGLSEYIDAQNKLKTQLVELDLPASIVGALVGANLTGGADASQ